MIISRRMRWSEHGRDECKSLVRKHTRKEKLDNLNVDGIILEWILEKLGGKVWTVFIWLRIGTSGVVL
jgi:hypothetical protein